MKIDREKILTDIANDKEWKQTCKNIVRSQQLFDYQTNTEVDSNYLADELYSEFLLSISELNEDKLINLYIKNELRYYLIRIILNQYKSNSSRYFRQIKKKYTKIIDYAVFLGHMDNQETILTDLSNNWLEFLNKKIETLHWYDKTIFKMYIDDNLSMKKIADKIGIPESSIKSTIKSVRNYLKELIEIERKKY